ncbi:MAG: 4Fe-4S dicluster domain-containing protein [Thermoplasmata archaeon]|nr:4Fe-4S dicluster domain-containing protein [Thermoplasmata archaeon]
MVSKEEPLGFLPKEKLKEFVQELLGLGVVLAPKKEGDITIMQEIRTAGELAEDFEQTRNNLRTIVEPQNEILLTYQPSAELFCEENLPEEKQKIVFWCRPCDARAISYLDDNFKDEPFPDPYYIRRRDRVLLIGLGCDSPFPYCFCSSIGGSPFGKDNLDIVMTRVDRGYILEYITENGQEIGRKMSDIIQRLTDDDMTEMRKVQENADKMIRRKAPDPSDISRKLSSMFESPIWKKWGDKCIGCGICTYLCPTCWCFDINDVESRGKGYRIRTWDSCQFPLFTLHTSSHNPRPDKGSRVRQRVMHKYNYHPINYGGRIACVGCGRCSELCPMDIDLISILEDISKAGEKDA